MSFFYLSTPIYTSADQLHRKKKSSKSQDKDRKNVELEKKVPVEESEQIRSESPAGSSGRNSPAASSSRQDRKTKAEKRFEEVQRKRASTFSKPCAENAFVADISSNSCSKRLPSKPT